MRNMMFRSLQHAAILSLVGIAAFQPVRAGEDSSSGEAVRPAVTTAEYTPSELVGEQSQTQDDSATQPSPAVAEQRISKDTSNPSPPVLRVAQPASAIQLRMLEPNQPGDETDDKPLGKPSVPPELKEPGRTPNPQMEAEKQGDPLSAQPEPMPSPPVEAEPRGQALTVTESEEPLSPIPDPHSAGSAEVDAASFKGITPGSSTLSELKSAWGDPVKAADLDGHSVLLYRVDPFDQIEVTIRQNKVASIVIRLKSAFPANTVTEQLQLTDVRPVLVSNEMGEILGQTFPERGVLFSFKPSAEPGKTTMQVASVVLEPVSAESFVLRAETYLETQTEASLEDLDKAIELDESNHRAYWLRARILAAAGEPLKGGMSSDKAVQLQPNNPQYRITRAQILGQFSRYDEAMKEAERALKDCESKPHVKARALCLLGDLVSSGSKPDYKKAFEYHSDSLTTATALVDSRHPAIRVAAKKTLIDAHLGAANDIAWGYWDEKEKAVPRWLQRAETIAEDMIENERGTQEVRLNVAARALAAYVGLEGGLDPTKWAEMAVSAGEQLIASASQLARKRQLQWDLGMALYDAVQTYQMRGEHDAALKHGERAIEYFEQGRSLNPDSLADAYLLGRLYFRLGAIHSIGNDNHRAAITWFEKAIPLFEQASARMSPTEHGRLGETYVSMGVSYWSVGQQENALKYTEKGVTLIEKGVDSGAVAKAALEVPYSNLSTMHRELGHEQKAEEFLTLAGQQSDTRLK
jgi:tetratricopeptide (TPR) repeat protein